MVSRHTCADKEHYRTLRTNNPAVTLYPCSPARTPSKAGTIHPSFVQEFVLRRFALSPRRLLAAAALGVVGALAFATTASACTIGVTGTPECDTQTGTVTVTWTVTASDNANVKASTVTPSGTTISLPSTIAKGSKGVTATQTVPGTAKEATLTVELTNADRSPKFDLTKKGTVALKGDCVATKPSESPSASPSAVASASASPSQSAVAPVSTSPASGTGAGSTLPVTGTSLTWFVVAAVVLIGGGAGLFVLSRRRRTNA
jgi:LPXTG-motif cell wall-anchored protein